MIRDAPSGPERDSARPVDDAPHEDDAAHAADAAESIDAAVHVDGGIDGASGSCATPNTGILATWSFAGATGAQVSTAATASAPGITAGAVTRSGGVTAVSGAGSINSSGWPTGAVEAAKYYTFTIAPPPGCRLDLTEMMIDARASASGPASSVVATSADAFAHTTVVATSAPGPVALIVTDATGTIELRVYGSGATSASGTLRIQSTLSLRGTLH